jgi:phage host-nuclease inhibitor protein Gam
MQTEPETADQDDAPPDVDERFHVACDNSANWLVRRIVSAREYKRRIELWAAAEIRRAEREEAFFLARWGAELERYVRSRIEEQRGRRKSLPLPAGTVGFRTAPRRLDVRDEQRLLAWCRRVIPSAIKTTEHVLKSSVIEHIERTGELPEGSELAGGDERFYIR